MESSASTPRGETSTPLLSQYPKWEDKSSANTSKAKQKLFCSILKLVLAIVVLVIGSLSFSQKGLNAIYLGSRTAGAITFTIGLLATLYMCNHLPSRYKTWNFAWQQLTSLDF